MRTRRAARYIERQLELNSFNEFGLAEPILRALTEEKYVTPTPIQAKAIPLLLERPRPDRHRPDRHRQDRRLRAADPQPPRRQPHPARAQDLPRAGAQPDARALRADPRQLPHLRPPPAHPVRARHRRRLDGPAGPRAAQRRRRPGRDAGPPARPGAEQRAAARQRSRCSCSTKPTACSTWASSTTSGRSSPSCRRSGRRCCSRPPCRRTSPTSPSRCCSDPATVAVTPAATTVERIAQRIVHVDRGAKQATLADLLRNEPVDRALVFTRTKHGADKVVRGLNKSGIARRRDPRQQVAGPARARARRLPQRQDAHAWSRPTSPPAASTSTASATSSTSICRTSRKATCTASAAPRAPARRASRSRCARATRWRSCATSRS